MPQHGIILSAVTSLECCCCSGTSAFYTILHQRKIQYISIPSYFNYPSAFKGLLLNDKPVCVFFPPVTSSESQQEKRKRKMGDSGVGSAEEAKKKKPQYQRPNYFISIPITNTQVKLAMPNWELMFKFQRHICSMTDQFSSDQCPGGVASAAAPARQSHDSCPNTPHHSFSHLSRQPGASRSVSGQKRTFSNTEQTHQQCLHFYARCVLLF